MRRLLCAAAMIAALAACGDNVAAGDDAALPTDAAVDGAVDAGPDAGARGGCLDLPGVLPLPPVGELPCELIPPGLTL